MGDPLKKALVTHSSTPAWETPGTDNFLAGYSPRGRERVGQDRATNQQQEGALRNGWMVEKETALPSNSTQPNDDGKGQTDYSITQHLP